MHPGMTTEEVVQEPDRHKPRINFLRDSADAQAAPGQDSKAIEGSPVVEGTEIKTHRSVRDHDEWLGHHFFEAVCKILFGVLVLFPMFEVSVAGLLAPILAVIEGWRVETGFWYTIGTITCLTNPITSATPVTIGGKAMAICISAWAIGTVMLCLGILISGELVQPIATRIRLYTYQQAQDSLKRISQREAVVKLFLCVFIMYPVVVFLISFAVGGPLALIEGWPWIDAMWWIAAILTGLGNPLVNNSPSTPVGNAMSVLAASWSIGCLCVTAAMIGGPLLDVVIEKHVRLSQSKDSIWARMFCCSGSSSCCGGNKTTQVFTTALEDPGVAKEV